ncbi:MAG: bifunctional oligoribonuclease/PAP phosphatase NrnA [Eubacterium sp.]|nr:bifunctional oligoribonuclease/PAP phosphatase NrnA [Eubacterium sp.]
MNDSFETIAEKLLEGDRIYLFPHENPDGDAIGSTAALCSMLRDMGKDCLVLIDEKLPDNLAFMDDDMFVIPDGDIEAPDISVAVDCSEITRFPKLMDIFKKAKTTICIDHHVTDNMPCDYNYIDPKAAAAGELIFLLMKTMDHKPTKREAEALFAAIDTDTGNFLYSNTTKQSHEIVCELYDSGIDVPSVGIELYETVAPEKNRLEVMALSQMSLFHDGKIALTVITQQMLEETGAKMSDAELVVAKLRTIKGVEIAIVLKERGPEKIFASMRAKSTANVRDIATAFGGGGHIKAAGCTMYMPLHEAVEQIIAKAEEVLGD